MKTKLDRVPNGLSELVGEMSARKGVPKTYIYKNIEDVMRGTGDIWTIFAPRRRK